MEPVRVGLVGCGNISAIYFRNGALFNSIDIVACADLAPERAVASAEQYSIPKACPVEALLADPGIELVLNLTIPKAHAPVGIAALEAGKSVYTEKPLAVTRDEGKRMVALAREKGVLLGAAPDTFLGAGLQTCRKLIDDGWIGEPVSATAFMQCHGHEHWHPDPDFYYQPGGGPMFDMGPYYLTALVSLMGPVTRVAGLTRATFPERLITSEARFGEIIEVNTATHIAGILEFSGGAIATMVMSFDVKGSCRASKFTARKVVERRTPTDSAEGQVCRPRTRNGRRCPRRTGMPRMRGLGVADMACALRTDDTAQRSVAYHALTMHAFTDSNSGAHARVESNMRAAYAAADESPTGDIDA